MQRGSPVRLPFSILHSPFSIQYNPPVVRCTVAHVDLDALQANYHSIEAYLARQAPPGRQPPGIIAVVKANAYGHGAGEVGRALEAAGARMLACADIEEGIALRAAGGVGPILVFGALSVSDLEGLFEYDLTPTCSTPAAGKALQAAAARHRRSLRYHLKIDTGLNRLGFRHDNLDRTLPELFVSPNLACAAVYTHFATADDPSHPLFEQQRARFDDARERIAGMGMRPPVVHAANSAALLREPAAWFDFVRPGLLLYGVAPAAFASTLPLRPVLSLRSRVVAVKHIRAGESVGYGSRFVADGPRRIATVPAGYADGLDTRLADRGQVLVGGRRVPIVGAVSMDMLAIDASSGPVYPGDEVVFLGEQGGERLTVSEMASAIGSIPYEVLCRLGSRIERVYNRGA
ncbi:MAG: alanine racemase [Acidobacteria bacterium]|nr:MAG: alanine racemase [Acidobacteriota bacterium]